MPKEKYKIVISKDALGDIKSTKKYILNTFKYREYAENFSKKIKKAIKELDSFPKGYEATGYVIEGLSIYFKPYSTYLISVSRVSTCLIRAEAASNFSPASSARAVNSL